MFAINRRRYLNALKEKDIHSLYECESKRFSVFDEKMAFSVFECFDKIDNSNKLIFIDLFEETWDRFVSLEEFMYDKSKEAFLKLKDLIIAKKEKEVSDDRGISAAIYVLFINKIEAVMKKYEAEND